jgi:hypothetical protein
VAHDPTNLRPRIREILLNDWDPTDAARSEASHQTYDAYISPLADLIRSGAGEAALVAFLKERESEIMCFPAIGSSHLHRVASKLRALGSNVNPSAQSP